MQAINSSWLSTCYNALFSPYSLFQKVALIIVIGNKTCLMSTYIKEDGLKSVEKIRRTIPKTEHKSDPMISMFTLN